MQALLGSAHKRARNKARADRQFDRMYGGQSCVAQNGASASSGSAASAPRAAVYSGHMGLRQRRASKIHEASGTPTTQNPSKIAKRANAANAASTSRHFSKIYKRLANAAATLVCLGLVVVFLYEPAAQCYCQMRELDRLNAEYAAVETHNDTLQTSVDTLQSGTGIEDSATSQFGMVKQGEQAVVVTGINSSTQDSDFRSNVVPGSVPAPDTWYSSVLDAVFGYEK
jgi:cell division protein FtsB